MTSLTDLASLPPFKAKPRDTLSGTAAPGEELLQVVVETPRGSRGKYSYDLEDRVMRLKSQLPAGMVFPFDFGFVPSTLGGDGDPLDVLVLGEEPSFPGCVLLTRLLGVMMTEESRDGETFRNDRLIAVADVAESYGHLRQLNDLPQGTRTGIESFFSTYHRLHGKSSRLLGWGDAEVARQLITAGLARTGKE